MRKHEIFGLILFLLFLMIIIGIIVTYLLYKYRFIFFYPIHKKSSSTLPKVEEYKKDLKFFLH